VHLHEEGADPGRHAPVDHQQDEERDREEVVLGVRREDLRAVRLAVDGRVGADRRGDVVVLFLRHLAFFEHLAGCVADILPQKEDPQQARNGEDEEDRAPGAAKEVRRHPRHDNRNHGGRDGPGRRKIAVGAALLGHGEPVRDGAHGRYVVVALAQGQSQAQKDELPEGAHETGNEGDQREHPDGDVHGLLGAPFVGEEAGKELRDGIPEEENRSEPADLDGIEAEVLLNVRQECQNADTVKVIDEIKQPDNEEDYPAVSPGFLSDSLCSLSHLPPPLDVSCGTGPLVSLPPRRDAP